MTKPVTDPTWATDTNYTADGDPWSSTATKVDPGSSRRAEGAEPDTFPAQWFNYQLNTVGNHIEYIHDVLEGSDTIPSVSRTINIDPTMMTLSYEGPNKLVMYRSFNDDRTFTAGSQIEEFRFGDHIPPGANITFFRALVNPAGSTNMVLDARVSTFNWGAPSVSAPSLGTDNSAGSTGIQVLSVSTGGHIFDPANEDLVALVTSGQNGDLLYGFQVIYEVDEYPERSCVQVSTSSVPRIHFRHPNDVAATNVATASVCLNRFVPDGATITQIRALVLPGAARSSGSRMELHAGYVSSRDYILPTGALGTANAMATADEDDGTSSQQVLSLSGLSYSMMSELPTYAFVRGGKLDSERDVLYGLQVVFTDPGPRNF